MVLFFQQSAFRSASGNGKPDVLFAELLFLMDVSFYLLKWAYHTHIYILLCKAERQYLLILQVSRYRLLALHDSLHIT